MDVDTRASCQSLPYSGSAGAKPKMASTKPKMAVLILGFLFVLAVIALITVAVTQNQRLPKNIKYGIVLDAGSSHTNLYVYTWPAEKENDTGVVQQVEVCKVEGPGISGYSQAVQNASRSLQHCLERAQEVVPQQQHQETPVYLGATAGMRLLSLENRHVAMEVLSAVENRLRSSPFNFQGARIITGQEEGAYGWITINYLLGSFKQSGWLNFLPKLTSIKETVGALDLGGASTQITFVPEQEQSESQENSLHFRLYGKSYNVYTHSFLCYGKDQALRMKLVRDLQNAETARLQDPCFHTGYERNVSIRDLYASPCTANYKQSLAFPQLHVVGSGDYQACQTRIEELFNKTSCPYSKCSFNGIFQPPLQGHFGAFSAFYFVMNFLNLSADSSPAPLNSAISTMKNFCSRPWSEVKAAYPQVKEKYLSEYCFSGTYIISLLKTGYEFSLETWQQIQFLGKIGSSDAGWTLGYMLNLTNMIPAEQPLMRPLSHAGYVGLMVLSSLVLVGALLLGWCIFRKPRCLRKGIV
ncbi:ectonucleoside triphosphate diphosphohydrolase 1 isoform X2 [Alligator mississippiensis]|uniref:Ectonucleoside triphosphate diphosphohydrolase 1 n=1 Tax=Alligator mississippiensis TaxID=8496 RepID=A0A151MRD6_ALLMI|nr:ectonucleoside triphosphate diphosphohydrolase 1 isoform X2 [Alligator mississippiensis]XP_019353197.1 ectonucleoside triphosphate diphosphohydrolase 1 isoform X2 [Alligator mississippiensis]XP_019353198.1 ectonucleoside triphosphate diphosphohydrolase 1 isoform X2 [Alligator mississippiensis]XP_059586286.1 ectonucleoside triphosphate diphosphohydrolase 1 isoform X2 [Alligator mississippiensis]KYO27106.1 ectonucleoside triphosphate diphosphohydrolase 1 isoform A [Alligator mississippiensis]